MVSGGKEQSTAPFCAGKPQGNQPGYRRQQREICNDFRRINVPPWIDEDQRMRPKQFAEIEQKRFTNDKQTYRKGYRPVRSDCATSTSLVAKRHTTQDS